MRESTQTIQGLEKIHNARATGNVKMSEKKKFIGYGRGEPDWVQPLQVLLNDIHSAIVGHAKLACLLSEQERKLLAEKRACEK